MPADWRYAAAELTWAALTTEERDGQHFSEFIEQFWEDNAPPECPSSTFP